MIGFAQPWFLLFLPIAAGPLILHLLSRARLKQKEFSSLFFLRRMHESRFRWLNLRDWLLLLLRSLFLLFLVLALAGPSWKGSLPFTGKKADLVVILDDSYSTASRFNDLKQTALRLLSELSPQSRAALITSSGSFSDTSWDEPRFIREKIEKTTASYSGRDISSAWSNAQELIKENPTKKGIIAVVSDGQERALEFVRKVKNPLDCEVMFFLDNRPSPENASITGMKLVPEYPLPGERQIIQVELSRNGGRIDNQVVLKDGVETIDQLLVNMGNGSKKIQFDLKSVTENLKINLDADSIPQDDEYYILPRNNERVRVALVGDEKSDFLKLALEASGGFDVERIPQAQLPGLSQEIYSLLICDGTNDISEAIKEAASSGLPVIALLGEGIKDVPGIFDVSGETDFTEAGNAFEVLSNSDLFSQIDDNDLREIRIWNYSRVKPSKGRVLVSFSSGEPFIFRNNPTGIIIVTTRFTPENTNIIYRSVFPAMVYRISEYALNDASSSNHNVGDTVKVVTSNDNPVIVETPSVQYELKPLFNGKRFEVVFPYTYEPGFYRIANQRFTINHDPRESSTSRINQYEIEKNGYKVFPLYASLPRNLSYLLLILALASLVVEFILILV
ncbi:VWA domain-containing protein [bacterium]|nr:VWA domain-containing protein [bacterium]